MKSAEPSAVAPGELKGKEMMKRISGLLFGAALLSLAIATVAFAQQPAEGIVIRQERIVQGPQGGPPPPPDANVVFFATESFGGKVVKGAPYSAEAVTETIQTLGDGNRIVNRITSMLYRDSEGRTRREQSLKGLGIFGTGEEPFKTIFINDPVAGVTFALDSRSHTAHKSVPFTFELNTKKGEGQQFEFKVAQGAATTRKRDHDCATRRGAWYTRGTPAGGPVHTENRGWRW